MRRLALLPLMLAACELPELVTPEAGSCPEVIDNQWPAFEDIDGDRPFYDDADIGYEIGQIPPDFARTDQHGDETCLWQMVGNYVVLDSSALWCVPCQIIAETVACTQESFGDELVYMTFITEGEVTGTPATDEDVQNWSDFFGLGEGTLTPVVNDAGAAFTEGFPGDGLPAFMLLGPDLRVLLAGEGETTEQDIRNLLTKELGASAEDCHSGEKKE